MSQTIEKVTMEEGGSMDVVQDNIEKLKAIFPEAFTENGVDLAVLRQLFGDDAVLEEGEEKYGLNWHGKKKARQIALTPSSGTLLPCPDESVDWENTQNLFIEGDNLEVLKLLQKSYANSVKMIYIDPPYNTENDFIYPDKFSEGLETYLKYTGQKGEEGWNVSESGREKTGRKHTNWLNMMYPRLKLAKSLLSQEGVIFISIDDNEQTTLKSMCDEIFGAENFVSQIIWHNSSRASDYVATEHEYVLVYAKNLASLGNWKAEREEATEILSGVKKIKDEGGSIEEGVQFIKERIEYYKKKDKKDKTKLHSWLGNYANIDDNWQVYYAVDLTGEGAGPARKFGDRLIPAPEGRHWMGQEYIDQLFEEDRIVWRNDRAYRKLYIQESEENLKSIVVIPTRRGSEYLKTLLGKDIFDKPKPHDLVKHFAKYVLDGDDVVLDFFAGSGTTAHSILELNVECNQNNRIITVQLPEVIDESKKAAIQFCEKLGLRKNIAEIAKERIRRVAANIKESKPEYKGDLGFKVFKLASSNIKAWNPDATDLENSLLQYTDNLVEGRSEEDVLYELLIKRGVDLTAPIECRKIAGKDVYSIGYGVLFACLDKTIKRDDVEELAAGIAAWYKELEPSSECHVFFRDTGFADDITKTNMAAILQQNGINHVRSL